MIQFWVKLFLLLTEDQPALYQLIHQVGLCYYAHKLLRHIHVECNISIDWISCNSCNSSSESEVLLWIKVVELTKLM